MTVHYLAQSEYPLENVEINIVYINTAFLHSYSKNYEPTAYRIEQCCAVHIFHSSNNIDQQCCTVAADSGSTILFSIVD